MILVFDHFFGLIDDYKSVLPFFHSYSLIIWPKQDERKDAYDNKGGGERVFNPLEGVLTEITDSNINV